MTEALAGRGLRGAWRCASPAGPAPLPHLAAVAGKGHVRAPLAQQLLALVGYGLGRQVAGKGSAVAKGRDV